VPRPDPTGGGSGTPAGTGSAPPVKRPRDMTPPASVRHLAADRKRPGRIVLTWGIANPGDVAQVIVRRGRAGACSVSAVAGTLIGGLSPRRRQVDTTERDKTAYCYAVFALDRHGNASAAATLGRVVNRGLPPGLVTDINARVGAGGAVWLWWTNPSGRIAQVVVARGPAGDCPTTPTEGRRIGDRAPRTGAVDANAQPGVRYCYSVFAIDRVGLVSPVASQPVEVRAPTTAPGAAAPPAPAASSGAGLTPIVRGGSGAFILAVLAFAAFRLVRRETQWHARTGYTLRDVARVDLRAYDPLALVIPAVLGASVVGAVVVFLLSV
jgi:large repetitive protein